MFLDMLSRYHLYDINHSFFKKGKYPKIDKLQAKIDKAGMSLEVFYETMSGLCILEKSCKNPPIKIVNRDRRTKNDLTYSTPNPRTANSRARARRKDPQKD